MVEKKKKRIIAVVSVLAAIIVIAGIALAVRQCNLTGRNEVPDRNQTDVSRNSAELTDSEEPVNGEEPANSEELKKSEEQQSSSDRTDGDVLSDDGGRHEDKDGNGKCDACGMKMTVTVDFYAMNDLHGKFDDSYGQPGVDELTTYLREKKLVDEHPIFLSSGDMWQGSAESNQTEGGVIIDWMNELGFVSMTLGNHEFDWGEETIADNAKKADFPFLAINVYDCDTLEQVSYCKSSVIVNTGDIKIGIIGAIGDCYSSIAPDRSRGFYIITGDELTQMVKDEALKLRGEGADYIVYSIHDGYSDSFYSDNSYFNDNVKVFPDSRFRSYYDTCLSNEYVDLVFEGHTHQNYVLMDSKGIYHLQNGGENKGISHVRVEFTHRDAYYSHECTAEEVVLADYYSRKESDSLRDEILSRYADEISFTKAALGYNPGYLDRDDLREIVARLYYETGSEKWCDRYDIILGGGFMSVRDPRHLDAGEVTYGDLQSLFPFDNELVLCSCSGYDLDRVFINSVNDNYFIYSDMFGGDLEEMAIEPDGIYYVVTDTYTSTYEPNNLTEIERYGEELYARDLLAHLFQKGETEILKYTK